MKSWRLVAHPGLPPRTYEVSADGDVRRLGRKREIAAFWYQGHRYVTLADERGNRRNLRLARLVLAAFDGDPGPSYVPTHLNGDHDDCRLVNLRWRARGDVLRSAHVRRMQALCERMGRV